MTGNKCIESFMFQDSAMTYHYYQFLLHVTVSGHNPNDESILSFVTLTTLLFGDFHCITFYGLLYRNHKDLDVLLRFSLFFISYFLNRQVRISATLFIEVNQTSWNKSLRQPCNICEAESYKTNSFPCLIQKVVRFARTIELSNMIHWLYVLTPSSLNFIRESVLFRQTIKTFALYGYRW